MPGAVEGAGDVGAKAALAGGNGAFATGFIFNVGFCRSAELTAGIVLEGLEAGLVTFPGVSDATFETAGAPGNSRVR